MPLLKGLFVRLIVPYLLLMTALLHLSKAQDSLAWYALTSVFFVEARMRGPLFIFWFFETYLHLVLLTCGLFLMPWFRRLAAARPFGVMIGLVLLSAVALEAGAREWPNGVNMNLTLDAWAYAFYLGWAAAFAKRWPQWLLVALLAGLLTFEQAGPGNGRIFWVTFGTMVLMTVPQLKLPAAVGKAFVALGSASYFMYLCHPLVIHYFRFYIGTDWPPALVAVLVYLGSVVSGLVTIRVWNRGMFVIWQRLWRN